MYWLFWGKKREKRGTIFVKEMRKKRTIQSNILRVTLVLFFGLFIGVCINLLHPKGIPWVGDWDHEVETRARTLGIQTIPLRYAYDKYQSNQLLFIDARSYDVFKKGHIKRAVSLSLHDLDQRVSLLEQILSIKEPVVIYCQNRSCDDALLLAEELRKMGKSNLFYYVDGFELWEAEGCPVDY